MMRCRSLPFLSAVFFLLLLIGTSTSFPETSSSSYQITGIVLNSVTGNPVPRCHLDASLAAQRRVPGRRQATTGGFDADEHGRFSISLPSAGAWHLTAAAPGYVSQAYDEHGNYSSAVVLTPSAPTIDLQFRLPPQSRIFGSILDEAGEPVRGATVELRGQTISGPVHTAQQFASRFFIQTDDRGIYEFANLPPGSYQLAVQAKPWYANVARQRQFRDPTTRATAPETQNSLLDVTYQLTWYPGVDDPSQAEPIVLSAGEDRPADFHLVPIPSLHLQIIPPSSNTAPDGRPIPSFPMIERIDPNGSGNIGSSPTMTTTGPQGQLEVSGLAPGTYRVRLQGQNQDSRSAVIELTQGSSRVIDFSVAASSMANVSIHFDDDGEEVRPMMVQFTDATNGQRYFPSGGMGRPMPLNGRRGPQAQAPRETTLQVPPGRYEVSLQDRGDSYLIGISAQGAEVAGRFVTVRAGDATCTLHTATGYATVSGVATLRGKPSVGAAVLLVPAGLEDSGSFTTLIRDQSNTDGSFDFSNVVPGQYILIAVDHGWQVNWNDSSALRNYLTQGVPMEIRSGQNIKQNIDAQTP